MSNQPTAKPNDETREEEHRAAAGGGEPGTDEQIGDQPVDDGRMPVEERHEDKRPTGPMSPHSDQPDVSDGRPKGPMSPSSS